MPNLVILDGHTANPGDLSWDEFKSFGELTVYPRTNKNEIVDRLKNADFVLTNKVVLDQETLSKLPNLKYIGVLASGVNNIDLKVAKEQSIMVCNVPGYSGQSVAQQIMSMILDHANKISEHSISVRKGDWSRGPDFSYTVAPLIELAGKTLGIFGYGDIGSRLAKMAIAFDMKVLIHKRTPPTILPSGIEYVDAETLFKQSDFLSLNCPLTPETEHLIRLETLTSMKENAVLINTGRGQLVHERDLEKGLKQNLIAAAYLDVLSAEPPSIGHPLLGAPNCKVTPHIAWSTPEARQRLLQISQDNLIAFLNSNPQNSVV